MKKGFFILLTGIFLIVLGSFLTLIGSGNTESSSVFVVFPFVFVVTGTVTPLIFVIMFILLAVMLFLPFYIFYKLSSWPYYEKASLEPTTSDTKICPICGTVLPFKAKYCYNCGYAFKEQCES